MTTQHQTNQTKTRRAINFAKRSFNPLRPYTYAFTQLSGLIDSLSDMFSAAKHTTTNIKDEASKTDEAIVLGRAIDDDKERFEFIYQQNGWTEEALAVRKQLTATNQKAYLIMSVIAFAFVLITAFVVNASTFGIALLIMQLLGAATFALGAAKMAHMRTQLDERELTRWNKFAGRSDFWRRVLMPNSARG